MGKLSAMNCKRRFRLMKTKHSRINPGMMGIAVSCFLAQLFFQPLSLASSLSTKGHVKYQTFLPENSSSEQSGDLRLNLSLRESNWALVSDYQILASQTLINDDNRLMDLTSRIHTGNTTSAAHRLDRLHLTYTSDQTVFRLGRQAVSWGNGLIYNPMDFFNPFDPTAIDREYKTGDDMFYTQYSFDNGNDLQAVWVGRRDDNGNSGSELSSLVARYHIFLDDYEIDFLLAEHFDNQLVGVGGVVNVGGAVWRGDIVSTEVDTRHYSSWVLNASYSWMAWGLNMSGVIEYYRNGFGIDDGNYSPTNLVQNPELLSRLERGELFTLGRHYLSGSVTVELTPLWLITPTLFTNLDDDSKFLQLVSQHDLEQNLQLLVAISIPQGSNDSEYGNVEKSLFVQLAWYF